MSSIIDRRRRYRYAGPFVRLQYAVVKINERLTEAREEPLVPPIAFREQEFSQYYPPVEEPAKKGKKGNGKAKRQSTVSGSDRLA